MLRSRSLICCAAAALSLSCAGKSPKAPGADLSYLPLDTVFVASVDAAALRRAPLYRDLDSHFAKEKGKWVEVKTFLLHLGIDPEKDLESFLLGYRSARERSGEWVAVLRGRFDVGRIEKGLEGPGARIAADPYRGKTIYNLVSVPEVGDLSLTLLDSTAVAVGRAEMLRRVLDVHSGKAPSLATNPDIRKLASGLDPRAQIWAVLDGREVARMMREREPAGRGTLDDTVNGLASMRSGRFSAAFSADLALALDLESDTEKNARNLADALRGILAFGKMGIGGKDPDTIRAIEAIRVENDRTAVRLRMDLSGASVKSLQSRFGESPGLPPVLSTPR